MEPLNNTYSVFQTLYIQKGSVEQRKGMEKKSNWKNIGVKPGKRVFRVAVQLRGGVSNLVGIRDTYISKWYLSDVQNSNFSSSSCHG